MTLKLARQNAQLVYDLLFYAASRALKKVGRDWLGVELGLLIVLHLWGQLLNLHPHCHCLLPAGGISLKDGRWISLPPGGTLPKGMLKKAFSKYFLKRLMRLYQEGRLVLEGELAHLADPDEFDKWHEALSNRRWIVHVPPAKACDDPREGGHGERIIRYMARYVSGMVFRNRRLVSIGGGRITFSYKDYRSGGRIKEGKLTAEEFIDRFLSHVLPAGMRQNRYYGFLSASQRAASLKQIREMLGVSEVAEEEPDKFLDDADAGADEPAPGYLCPVCQKGRMIPVRELPRPTVRQAVFLHPLVKIVAIAHVADP